MCSIEEAAASTFNEADPEITGLVPVSEVRYLIEKTYKKLDRKVKEQDIQDIMRHMSSEDEISINKDEFVRMVKDTIEEQGQINFQSI